jgi:gliding motility-associated-like protein
MIYQNAVITVPNGFTPDGNGLNDVFRITANQPINQFSMRIFNRWGEEVFHSEDYTQGWDGYHRSKEQNSGVYLYIINYQDLGDGEYKVLNGNLTLIR